MHYNYFVLDIVYESIVHILIFLVKCCYKPHGHEDTVL